MICMPNLTDLEIQILFVELIDFADVFFCFPHQEDSALVADIIPVSIGREMAVKVGDPLEAGRHLLEWHALETYMAVSKNRGTPKWMVKIMESPIKNGWFGCTPFFGNTHIRPLGNS